MTITVNGPNGVVINFPEGTDGDTIKSVMDRALGRSAPQEKPSASDPVADFSGQVVRGVNRGINSVLSLPGEVAGAVADKLGYDGNKFRWNNQLSRFLDSPHAKPTNEAGRYGDAIGRALGGSALPTGALLGNAARMAAAAPTTTGGAIANTVGQMVQRSPAAFVAGDAAAATGGAVGSQMAQEEGAGPATQAVAGIAGALAPGAAAYGVARAMRPVQRARVNMGENGAYGSIADDLGMSVDDFSANVARGTDAGGLASANRQHALNVLGEEMVAANGNVQAAQARTIARIAQDYGVTPQTAAQHIRSLTSMYDDSPLMLSEYPAVATANNALRGDGGGLRRPQNVDIEALNRTEMSNPQMTMDYLANNGNAQSAITTRNAVADRQDALAPAMRRTLEGMSPQIHGRAANITDAEQVVEQSRQLGRAAYQAAYNGPINNNPALGLPQLLNWYERQAFGRSGEASDAMRRAIREFLVDTPNGPVAMMSLRHLQDARGAVRGMISEAERGGRTHIVQALQPFYTRVTRMMEAMSPQWGVANRQWADMRFEQIAAELGDAFAKRAGPRYREQLREFEQLHPQAQNIVRIHWLQQQFDKLENLGDAHSVAKLFLTDHARNSVRALFGPQAAVDFTRAVRDLKVAQQTQAMMHNSATHRRGMAQRQKDADTGLVAAANTASVQGVRNWLLDRATQLLTERRNRPMSRILTTPMSDTATVAMHLQRMRQQQSRLQQFAQPAPFRPSIGGLIGSQFGQE